MNIGKDVYVGRSSPLLQTTNDTIMGLEQVVFEEAERLVEHFREQRDALQEGWYAERIRQAKLKGEQPPARPYTRVGLFTRTHHGTLELRWKVVRKKPVAGKNGEKRDGQKSHTSFKDLLPTSGKNYHSQTLQAHAHVSVKDLVVATEVAAAFLRKQWRELVELRRALRSFHTTQQVRLHPVGSAGRRTKGRGVGVEPAFQSGHGMDLELVSGS
jgi:hypothetical protein